MELLLDAPPVLVVNKPGGLATEAVTGIDNMAERVRVFEKARAGTTGNIYLGIPHRLDRPATGAIAFARNIRATRRISEQFAHRLVEKTYWVLVQGHVDPPAGTWHDWMRKIPGQARSELVAADHPDARHAVLHYTLHDRTRYGSWLEVQLETGRTHQIRLQAAARGHAVLGDELYGAEVPFGPVTDDWRARHIALHARRLAFQHPKSREQVEAIAPLPTTWLEVVEH